MKKILMAMLCLAFCGTVSANDNELYIEPKSGEAIKWEVSSLQKMVFQNGNIVLTMKNGTSSYLSISAVKRMYFRPLDTGIDAVLDGKQECTWDGTVLHIAGYNGGKVNVYAVNGVLVLQSVVDNNGSVSLAELQSGMYIVNIGGTNVKIVK